MERVVANLVVDKRIEEYADIFPSELGHRIGAEVEAETLRPIVDQLLVNWRSTAYLAGMPAVFVHSQKAVIDGFTEDGMSSPQLTWIVEKLLKNLAASVSEISNKPSLQRRLKKVIESKLSLLRKMKKTNQPSTFQTSEAWTEYLGNPAFFQYVWSSERAAFQSVYNAYEDFLVECVRVANALPSLRVAPEKEFVRHCRAFGEEILADCWRSKDVERVRLIRVSLTHASGRLTKPMREKGTDVKLMDEVVQIWPSDVREAIETLSTRVIRVIEAAKARPEFQ